MFFFSVLVMRGCKHREVDSTQWEREMGNLLGNDDKKMLETWMTLSSSQ